MRVSSVLKSKGDMVATVAPETSVSEVLNQLSAYRVGALVVSTDTRTISGIVSERDVVRSIAADGREVLDRPVSTIMTTDVTTCGPDMTIQDLAKLMTEQRIRHVPVVVEGALAGIVSIGDVVKSRINELETETEAIREYVHGH